jgi:hypothetical protein
VTLEAFPRRKLRGDRAIHRIHRAARGPWWFSSDGSGRFDPLGTGLGACYLAERPLGAWVDVFRKRLVVAEAEVAERALLSVTLGRDLRLADLTSRRALAFGVTASLGADEEYGDSQAFAVEAAGAAFQGIRYLLRHDPAQQLYGIALFGPAGGSEPGDSDWPQHYDGPLPEGLAAEAQAAFGFRVIPAP